MRARAGAALAAMLCAASVAGCGDKNSPATAAGDNGSPDALTKVTFNMAWLPQGSQAGVIAAIERGFYAARGLEVEAVRGFGGTRTINEVDQGMFDFGYGDPVSVILNRANGGRVRLIGVINERWPAGLCYLRERHRIEKPADLAGLSVGGGQNSAVQVLLPLWLERNGVPPDKVKVLQLNPSVIVASLIEGKIDAAECWLGNSRPLFQKEAAAAGFTLDWIEYGAHNLDVYGSGLITTDATIAERPDVVSGFVAATYEGYRYAQEHPEGTRDLMVSRYPTLDADVTLAQIQEISTLLGDQARLGVADDAKVGRTVEFVAKGHGLDGKVTAADIYTNQFVAH